MIYKKIGFIFRKIREEKGYSLSTFLNLGISKAALSKFERGESMMRVDKVISALSFMGVSFEEFEFFINNYSLGEADSLFLKVESATFAGDTCKLEQLHKEALHLNLPFIALAAKASFSSINESDIDRVMDYFYEMELWGYKELGIFNLIMEQLSTSNIYYLLELFLKNADNSIQVPRTRNYLAQACYHALAVFSYRGYKNLGEILLWQIESKALTNTMFLRNLHNFTQGYWIYNFESHSKGNEMMVSALETMHSLSSPEIAQYYQKKYSEYTLGRST